MEQTWKGKSTWDRFTHTPGKIKNNETGDIADDHYRLVEKRYRLDEEDRLEGVSLFDRHGPALIPAGRGKVNQKGLDFYSNLVDGLLDAGYHAVHHIEPLGYSTETRRRRRLGSALHRRCICGVRRSDVAHARRPRQKLDHSQ